MRRASLWFICAFVASCGPGLEEPALSQAPGRTDRLAEPSVQVGGHTLTLSEVAQVAPIVIFHPDERYWPCAIETLLRGAQLLDTAYLVSAEFPTQADLWQHRDDGSRLELDPSSYSGDAVQDGAVQAPMYVAAQTALNGVDIDLRFVFLHAYNGAQAMRVNLPLLHFTATIPHFAEHPGDIEGVTVQIDPNDHKVLQVRMEAHGVGVWLKPHELLFEHGTHPVVMSAYNAHGTYSAADRHDWFPKRRIPALGTELGDLVSHTGPRWTPFAYDVNRRAVPNGKLRFVGMYGDGTPVSDQLWAGFAGWFGRGGRNAYAGVQCIGPTPLLWRHKLYANVCISAFVKVGALRDRMNFEGTLGLGARPLVHTF